MADKLLEALDAELAHFERTKGLSEKEQMKADEKWTKSKEHRQLVKLFREALLGEFVEDTDKK